MESLLTVREHLGHHVSDIPFRRGTFPSMRAVLMYPDDIIIVAGIITKLYTSSIRRTAKNRKKLEAKHRILTRGPNPRDHGRDVLSSVVVILCKGFPESGDTDS